MAVTGKLRVNPFKRRPVMEKMPATMSQLDSVTLIEHILKGIGSRDKEQILFERYTKLKTLYFNGSSKNLVGDFLHIKQHQDKSLDEILAFSFKRSDRKEFIHIMKLFIAGEFDAVHTAKMLDRYCQRHRPSWLRIFSFKRWCKLTTFIEAFKNNCMKDIMQENIGFMEESAVSQLMDDRKERQFQSLFPARVTMATPMQAKATRSDKQRQRQSLFITIPVVMDS